MGRECDPADGTHSLTDNVVFKLFHTLNFRFTTPYIINTEIGIRRNLKIFFKSLLTEKK